MSFTIHRAATRLCLAFGLAGCGLVLSAAATDQQVLAQDDGTLVSYSRAQAESGEKRYERDCEECHGDDLKGGLNGGAPLRGLAFEEKYFRGAPASWLFEFMIAEMPPNAPGRYGAHTYAELMAYILKKNGFQPGAPLPEDLDALDMLIMEK